MRQFRPGKNPKHIYHRSKINVFADENRMAPTHAEARFALFLADLSGGVLLGRYLQQHVVSGKWILDFFFPEVRLGIEIDGRSHDGSIQRERDEFKELDCQRFDITLFRITNAQVLGDPSIMTELLRNGWAKAKARDNQVVGRPYPSA